MPAAFVTPLSIDPPLIGVAVHPSRHTHDMIKYSEEFALNIPTRELLHHVQYLGSVSGAELSKLELTKLPDVPRAPDRCAAAGGLRRLDRVRRPRCVPIGDHTLFVGKVVAAQVEKDAFDETWLLADPEERPLHYLGVNRYAMLGDVLEARIPQAADIKRDVEAGAAESATKMKRRSGESARPKTKTASVAASAGSSRAGANMASTPDVLSGCAFLARRRKRREAGRPALSGLPTIRRACARRLVSLVRRTSDHTLRDVKGRLSPVNVSASRVSLQPSRSARACA